MYVYLIMVSRSGSTNVVFRSKNWLVCIGCF